MFFKKNFLMKTYTLRLHCFNTYLNNFISQIFPATPKGNLNMGHAAPSFNKDKLIS